MHIGFLTHYGHLMTTRVLAILFGTLIDSMPVSSA